MSSTNCVMDINSRILFSWLVLQPNLMGIYRDYRYPLSAILFNQWVFFGVSPQHFGIDQPRQVASRPAVHHGESARGNAQREHRRPGATRHCVNMLRSNMYTYTNTYCIMYANATYQSIIPNIHRYITQNRANEPWCVFSLSQTTNPSSYFALRRLDGTDSWQAQLFNKSRLSNICHLNTKKHIRSMVVTVKYCMGHANFDNVMMNLVWWSSPLLASNKDKK